MLSGSEGSNADGGTLYQSFDDGSASSWVAQLCAIEVNFLTRVLQGPSDKM